MQSGDLFEVLELPPSTELLGPSAVILRGFVRDSEYLLLDALAQIAAAAPFRHLTTPGGYRMSVAMTNCGEVGWVSDRNGYRYDPLDPITTRPWPAMPEIFGQLASEAAAKTGFANFKPEACLINRYQPGARLSLHRDRDEDDAHAPIVSVSLGIPAKFLWGGLRRTDKIRRIPLISGDVVVWGGESRFVYHGVAPIAEALHPLTGPQRFNLTFRKVY